MRATTLLLHTTRDVPADAETPGHRLLLRAGCIRRVSSGIHHWLPLGLRVLRRLEQLLRNEMDALGALEIAMPMVQPLDLWAESGRDAKYGDELLRITDRHGRVHCLGPTHEELVTDLARRELRSYRQLPLTLYQLQSKFRDERRPRAGLLRAREFLMKDAYSFHADAACLDQTYADMHAAYARVLERLGANYRVVQADTGSIGGARSHEFHLLAEAGEDTLAISDGGRYAANLELATAAMPSARADENVVELQRHATPGAHRIDEVCALLGTTPDNTVKTLIVEADVDGGMLALVLRGNDVLNETKALHIPAVQRASAGGRLRFAAPAAIAARLGCGIGSLGPVGLPLPTYVDAWAARLGAFVCGANEDGWHLSGATWARDARCDEVMDLRTVQAGDPSPAGDGALRLHRGIEVGRIFQLGTRYTEAMRMQVQDDAGATLTPLMGCYGFGVSRTVAAIVESAHDERGIVWPAAIAPFQVHVLTLGTTDTVRDTAERLYRELRARGVDVLLDDRPLRPGEKFADADLVGIPWRLVIGDRALARGEVELRARGSGAEERIALENIVERLASTC